jgi:hypothetical protein
VNTVQVKMSVSFNFINLNVGVLGPIPFMWDVLLLYTKQGGEITLELMLDKQIFYTNSIGTCRRCSIAAVVVFLVTPCSSHATGRGSVQAWRHRICSRSST